MTFWRSGKASPFNKDRSYFVLFLSALAYCIISGTAITWLDRKLENSSIQNKSAKSSRNQRRAIAFPILRFYSSFYYFRPTRNDSIVYSCSTTDVRASAKATVDITNIELLSELLKPDLTDKNDPTGPWWWWSSGQHARLLLRQSEFESRWSLQFFSVKFVLGKNENKQNEAQIGPFKKERKTLFDFWYLSSSQMCCHTKLERSLSPWILPHAIKFSRH